MTAPGLAAVSGRAITSQSRDSNPLPAQGYVLSLGHGEFQRITQGTHADNGYLHAGQDAHLRQALDQLRVHPQGDDTADGIGL